MEQRISDGEAILALRAIREHGNVNAAATATGLPETTLRRRRDAGKRRGLTADSFVQTEEDRLVQRVRELERDVKRLAHEHETVEEFRRRVFNLATRAVTMPKWLNGSLCKGGGVEVPMLFVSDIHYTEVVNPVEVAGVNAYNVEIADQRLEALFTTAADLIERDTGKTPVPGVVVALGGDMISGDIHEELQDTNELYTTQAIVRLVGILKRGISLMADNFGRVFVPCVVGNHGRMTRKPRMKGRVYTSFEYLLYCMLEREFAGDPRVKFMVPGESDAYFKVNGKRFLLTHGDALGVKGGDGIIGALGPIMRGTVKVGESEKQIGRDFDYLMMGHWHYPLYLPRTIVNGAVKGYDEYARLGLRVPYAPASQLLWRVHPQHGLTVRREIILQEPLAPLTKTPTWVEIFTR